MGEYERADIGSSQTVGFHTRWYGNGSDVVGGSVYVNNTEHVTNSTGWINLNVSSLEVGKNIWVVTGVNCSGVTMFEQTAQAPSMVWDEIKIVDEGTTKESMLLGDTVTLWFRAVYEYDNVDFGIANGILYLNDSAMSWSTTKNRWEYIYVPSAPGSKTFVPTKVHDTSYNLTVINHVLGAQTVSVWSSPFLIVTNSTVSELTFDSTKRTLSFIVSGPSGTVGFMNVTLAKTLVENIEQMKVYLDGSEINCTAIDTNDSWLMYFFYNHSTHRVVISLDSTATKSFVRRPLELVVHAIEGIAIAVLAAILVSIKKKHGATAKSSRPQTNSLDV